MTTRTMQREVISPITGNNKVRQLQSFDTNTLRSLYLETYGYDIIDLLDKDISAIELYQCLDSGYRFWWPITIVGDSKFYNKLQEKEWYYMPDKWEFREAINHMPAQKNLFVLEIGAAKGDFLGIMRQHNLDAALTGLELNQEAADEARRRGFNVLTEMSGDHAKTHKAAYDVIASFQVLEHIPNPMDLLRDALHMLKPGGKLIIGVPDNSRRAFPSIFIKPDADLNMPPHHQGLWDIPSLAYLIKVLPLQLDFIAVEPATASHHSNGYRGPMKSELIQRFGRVLGFGIYALGRPFFNYALKHVKKYLPAHTVLAVYRKLDK